MNQTKQHCKTTLLFTIFLLISSFIVTTAQTTDTKEVILNENWIDNIGNWYEENINYTTITALMTIESSFIPFPSEAVIPPASYAASQPESKLNLFLITIFATLGSLLGAYINYFLALWLGRPILYKLADSKAGSLLLLSSKKIKYAENYFNKHGKVSTFIGRLIPGIRQLISIPAGLSKMNIWSFSFFTILGAGIWNSILVLLGYMIHGQKELINTYSHTIGITIIGILISVTLFYFIRFLIRRNHKAKV